MEMGVDIGGLSAVAMNNAPPGPANFLQRAGRAGRRDEPVALSFTMCRNTPHGEAVFANPLWPFTTPLFVPRVLLQSDRIVVRHLCALALGTFLARIGSDPPRLTAGWFYLPPEEGVVSPADESRQWCIGGEAEMDDAFSSGAGRLLRGTPLAGLELSALVGRIAAMAGTLHEKWREEHGALAQDLALFRAGKGESPRRLSWLLPGR